MALFFQKERGIIVLFFQKGRGMTVFFLNATSFGNTIGDLWEFCGLSVAFCAPRNYKQITPHTIAQKSYVTLYI